MFLLQSIRIALQALRVNKLRSSLTMLGIVIGVGAVIAMEFRGHHTQLDGRSGDVGSETTYAGRKAT